MKEVKYDEPRWLSRIPLWKRFLILVTVIVVLYGGCYGYNKYHENQLHEQQPNPPGVTEG